MKTSTSRISDLEWVQPARQERSQRTLERLFAAAADEIREKGYADASVTEIARRAGCAVGTVYRRFRDKTALLHALDERWCESFLATIEDAVSAERWSGASILEILAGYIEFTLNESREHAGLHRAARIMAAGDVDFAERQARLTAELHARLRGLLLERREEIGHPDPPLAVEFVLEQLRGMLAARAAVRDVDARLFALDEAQFLDQALDSVSAYLQLEGEPS